VRLQTLDRPCYTRDLLRSFQWNNGESFEQHDVQEFCRILFEAIEKTHKNTAWIKELFAGSTGSFIDCGKHRRLRSEMFLDLSLAIRNQFTKETYSSVEQCLQEYLRPEKLEDKIECEECGEKVFVEKGLIFESLPPILTLQLNRFELNYETFQREKLNSFLYFPELLELHRYLKPFDQIAIKGLPAGLSAKAVVTAVEKSARTNNIFDVKADKPKERKKSDDKLGSKETVTFFDEENHNKRSKPMKEASAEETKQQSLDLIAQMKEEAKLKLLQPITKKKAEKAEKVEKNDFEDDMLFGTLAGNISSKDWASGSFEKKPTY
jgi:ubiquitin carboxyl-terminal hydrolase 47